MRPVFSYAFDTEEVVAQSGLTADHLALPMAQPLEAGYTWTCRHILRLNYSARIVHALPVCLFWHQACIPCKGMFSTICLQAELSREALSSAYLAM